MISHQVFFFFVPLLPDKALSPNGSHGTHHAVTAARRELREAAYYCAREATRGRSATGMVRISVEYRHSFGRPRDGAYRPRDVFNAVSALKPLFDGIVDSGYLSDDDYQHAELGVVRIVRVDPAHEGLAVTLEEQLEEAE